MEYGVSGVRNKGGGQQSVIAVGIIVVIMKAESNEQKERRTAKGTKKNERKINLEIKWSSCGFLHCELELVQVDANESFAVIMEFDAPHFTEVGRVAQSV
jgi:hypothetical protein